MLNVYIDIETIPSAAPPALEDMKPPKTHTKPDTIAKWRIANQEAVWRKEALQSEKGRIFCVCVAVGEGAVQTFTESQAFFEFLKALKTKQAYVGLNFIIHNVDFDKTFLFHEAIRQGDKAVQRIFAGLEGDNFTCTMQMFKPWQRNYKISLAQLMGFLGIPSHKNSIDGSKIFDYWQAGRTQEICDYCVLDVEKLRECYYKLLM